VRGGGRSSSHIQRVEPSPLFYWRCSFFFSTDSSLSRLLLRFIPQYLGVLAYGGIMQIIIFIKIKIITTQNQANNNETNHNETRRNRINGNGSNLQNQLAAMHSTLITDTFAALARAAVPHWQHQHLSSRQFRIQLAAKHTGISLAGAKHLSHDIVIADVCAFGGQPRRFETATCVSAT